MENEKIEITEEIKEEIKKYVFEDMELVHGIKGITEDILDIIGIKIKGIND